MNGGPSRQQIRLYWRRLDQQSVVNVLSAGVTIATSCQGAAKELLELLELPGASRDQGSPVVDRLTTAIPTSDLLLIGPGARNHPAETHTHDHVPFC